MYPADGSGSVLTCIIGRPTPAGSIWRTTTTAAGGGPWPLRWLGGLPVGHLRRSPGGLSNRTRQNLGSQLEIYSPSDYLAVRHLATRVIEYRVNSSVFYRFLELTSMVSILTI